ncbi:uncharacterized protein [Eurosta solidaginis]|uniref:uncharacterized protein n=1 Tax=Eurosta solidaginis TaxID=178769 RepID=UPI0035314526
MGLCINCLSKGHQLSNCASTHKCKICSRQHHSLLHRGTTSESSTTNLSSAVHTHMDNTFSDHIILATAMVLVRDASGNYRFGRALLDSCSQVNFITDELSQKLMLPRSKHNIEIQSIGESSTNIKYKTSTNIKSQATGFELPLTFCITSHIAYQPEPELDISFWHIPSNIVLADNQFNHKTKKIDLLLGTESFFSLLSVGQIKLDSDLPILQKTLLGWIVSGRYRSSSVPFNTNCLLACEESIDSKLEKLWQIEEVSTKVDVWTREQHTCEKLYNDTVTRNSSDRIIVKIPFKDDPAYIGESYTTALRRFISLERRLERSPNLKSQYVAFMDEYQSLGHMEVVPYPNLNEPHYYIPHHCVLKPNSTSTKLRVVFDASCRTSTQKSINDLQMVGPTIQSELVILLLRFRLHRFALTADIVKMYRQLNTVTYGMASAPYLAIRSLNYLADLYQSNFVIGSNIVKSSFYVDDLLCVADSIAELSRIQDEVTELLKLGGFDLAKWHSNHQRFRYETTDKDLNLDTSLTSTLGLKWDQIQDNFIFSFLPKQPRKDRVTKRTILFIASSLFDPLGLVAPVIVTAKILLQELWLLKLERDESVPQNIQSAWKAFVNNLSDLSSVKVPRYCLSTNIQSLQIHGFCDSSIRAEFTPASANHFGGIWEAAVKSAKGHLHRSVMNARLTYEELTTVLVEIEAVLNSRPISPLSSDSSDLEALTPGHFITGSALKSLPERMVVDKLNNWDRWNQITALNQMFWKQWSHEYISELQSRKKWNTENENIAKDTMVLIHEDNVPQQRWLIGRVIDTIPGRDGRVRVVNLRTPKGTCRRPIHKIAILPI